jgi:hypothetical protein
MEPLPPKICRDFHRWSDIWLLLNCSLTFCSLSSIEVIASFRGNGYLVFASTGLVAVTAIVNRYRNRRWQDQRNFLTCFFWFSLVASLGVSLIVLQDDEIQRHDIGAILFIGCCTTGSWIVVFVRWCRQDVLVELIVIVAGIVFIFSLGILRGIGRDSYSFETCLISVIVMFSLAAFPETQTVFQQPGWLLNLNPC